MSKNRVLYARTYTRIMDRYNAQELIRVNGRYENIRRQWTPAQVRRMRKSILRAKKKFLD